MRFLIALILALTLNAVATDQKIPVSDTWPSEEETKQEFEKWFAKVNRELRNGRVYSRKDAWMECERWLRRRAKP